MRALVTGGAGFIGSHIVERLVSDGWDVVVLDDLSGGKTENIAQFFERVEFVKGSITDRMTVKRAVADVDYVFHEAAIVSVQASFSEPQKTMLVNVEGTKTLLDEALGAGVKRVIFASSAAVYGNAEPPIREDFESKPLSPYGESKVAGEKLMLEYAKKGLETVSLRYFNVYGPRQNPSSQYSGVITRFIHKMLNGERPIIYGDGNQTRDFIFIEDVVSANMLAAKNKNAAGDVFNIGSGVPLTINQLVGILSELLDYDGEPEYAKRREGDIYDSYADISKAQSLLGFNVTTSIEDGLKKTIEWQRGLLP